MEEKILKEILGKLENIEGRLRVLEGPVTSSPRSKPSRQDDYMLDFDLDERAFLKKYASRKSGYEVFAIICIFLAKGNFGSEVNIQDIQKTWQRCYGVFGFPYHSTHATRAKEAGFVKPGKRGAYVLGPRWEEPLMNADVQA